MDRSTTTMDLRSVSCKGIKSFNLFQKPSTFAVLSVVDPSAPARRQKFKTAADTDGGENPEWPDSFRFDLGGRDPALALEIDVMVEGSLPLLLLGERVVGRVHVPVADLVKEGGDGSVRHVSYRVLGTDGSPNGEIRFSYNINFPPPAAAGGYRPPPPRFDPVVPSPPGGGGYGFYPPPGPQYPAVSSAVSGFYPPPPPQHAGCCPPPPPQQYPAPPLGESYPLQYQHEPAACYPPPAPAPACCYPSAPPLPPEGGGYRPEVWDHRRLYG